MRKNIICISCPIGCELEVEYDRNNIIAVSNCRCKKGKLYAEKELFRPERIVTTTVRILGSFIPLIPVRTEKPVPKGLTFDVVKTASKVQIDAPVKLGDVVVENICETGINLVATRSIERIETW